MRVNDRIGCKDFPCLDMNKESYVVPDFEVEPDDIKMVMVSEAPPEDLSQYFYASGEPFYLETTIQAFEDAGVNVSSMGDILALGVYITTAVKCGKIGYSVSSGTIERSSHILEDELALFPNVKVILAMGDVAIRAINYIGRRRSGKRVVPSGSTYKIRKNQYFHEGIRVFPSYLQTGRSYLIEKSKRKMIAEDIRTALELVK